MDTSVLYVALLSFLGYSPYILAVVVVVGVIIRKAYLDIKKPNSEVLKTSDLQENHNTTPKGSTTHRKSILTVSNVVKVIVIILIFIGPFVLIKVGDNYISEKYHCEDGWMLPHCEGNGGEYLFALTMLLYYYILPLPCVTPILLSVTFLWILRKRQKS